MKSWSSINASLYFIVLSGTIRSIDVTYINQNNFKYVPLTTMDCVLGLAYNTNIVVMTAVCYSPSSVRAHENGGLPALAAKGVHPDRPGASTKRMATRYRHFRSFEVELFASHVGIVDVKVLSTHCTPAAFTWSTHVVDFESSSRDEAWSAKSYCWRIGSQYVSAEIDK